MNNRHRHLYSICIHSTRMEYSYYDFNKSVEENAGSEDHYGLIFRVIISAGEEEAAVFVGKLFDEVLVYEEAMDILTVCGSTDQEEYLIAEQLNDSKVLQVRSDAWLGHRGWSGYLTSWHVNAPYREENIDLYILRNLHKLLRHSLNIDIRCLCAAPKPGSAWPIEETKQFDEKRKQKMELVLKTAGFTPLPQSVSDSLLTVSDSIEVYVRVYSAPGEESAARQVPAEEDYGVWGSGYSVWSL